MAGSAIEWTETTWNPVTGCTIISPGCSNCYAMRMAARLEAMGHDKYRGTTRLSARRSVWSGKVTLYHSGLEVPLTWLRPQRIFVNSMSDLFHEDVPVEFIQKIWEVMKRAHWHTFQILSKRAERMRDIARGEQIPMLPNVWVGTSVESADYLWRIDLLRETPATIRFISFEPLIAPIYEVDLSGIDWAIVGGESGPGARPMEAGWVRKLKAICERQGVAFFFKQWGGRKKKKGGRLLDGRTWDDYPIRGRRCGDARKEAA